MKSYFGKQSDHNYEIQTKKMNKYKFSKASTAKNNMKEVP